jgi:membrane-associated phospholipid phosphatase
VNPPPVLAPPMPEEPSPAARPPMGTESLVHAPNWLTFGFPFLGLALLGVVELGGLNTSLFYHLNSISEFSSPAFWAHVTILGDGLICAVFLLPWFRRHPDRVWGGVLGALIMFVVLRSFKGALNLPRPLGVFPEEMVTVIGPGHRKSAFPSGHTATIFTFFGIWALSERRRWASAALILPPALVGLSRIVVGVHWPVDMLAGAALGWVSAWLGLSWAAKTPWGMGRRSQLILGTILLVCALVMLAVDHTGYPGVLWFQRSLAAVFLAMGAWEFKAIATNHRSA